MRWAALFGFFKRGLTLSCAVATTTRCCLWRHFLQAAMLSKLAHPHVIKYKGLHFSKTRRQYSLLMEYAAFGSLETYMKKRPKGVSEQRLALFLSQVRHHRHSHAPVPLSPHACSCACFLHYSHSYCQVLPICTLSASSIEYEFPVFVTRSAVLFCQLICSLSAGYQARQLALAPSRQACHRRLRCCDASGPAAHRTLVVRGYTMVHCTRGDHGRSTWCTRLPTTHPLL